MKNINKLTCPSSEEEIKLHWKYFDRVYISCVCITYNHELYIRNALDSILAQKSEYQFELVIHDDCSTDSTKDILLEYKNKFPNIIKLILQEKNQHSQNKKILPLTIPFASGEFLAPCEGDDFWIDEYKIQKQIKKMYQYKNINICFTSAESLFNNSSSKTISYHDNIERIFTIEQVIQGGGNFMPTASIIIRTEILKSFPNLFYFAPIEDYFLQICASLDSGALYIPDTTSVYRINSIGSWTSQRKLTPLEKIIKEGKLYIKTFNELKKFNIDHRIIDDQIAKQHITLATIAIRNNYLSEAKKLIKTSWFYSKRINKKQIILYYLKDTLFTFRLAYIIKDKFTS
ncbi:glycosyltransferase [Providencia rettgeri]|uniref:glycosyltransferase n=1 Tax=Providencia rettgeri TaxID=587 RepID=UPI003D2E5511